MLRLGEPKKNRKITEVTPEEIIRVSTQHSFSSASVALACNAEHFKALVKDAYPHLMESFKRNAYRRMSMGKKKGKSHRC